MGTEHRSNMSDDVATKPQPDPTPPVTPQVAVWDLVINDAIALGVDARVVSDMRARDAFGAEKYKTRLMPGNGRSFLADAYQEALDLVVYLRGELAERGVSLYSPTPEDARLVAGLYSKALAFTMAIRHEIGGAW
jgi:hypothetical protein